MPNPAPNGVAAVVLSLMVKGTVTKKCSPKKTPQFTHMFTLRWVGETLRGVKVFAESDLHVTFINERPGADKATAELKAANYRWIAREKGSDAEKDRPSAAAHEGVERERLRRRIKQNLENTSM